MLSKFSGATIRRTIDRSHAQVPEHAHGWPMLSLFVIGAYENRTEIGDKFLAAPSAVLYLAGVAHRNTVGAEGFEQIEIEFDPDWLGRTLLPSAPVSHWTSGRIAAETRSLVAMCGTEIADEQLRLRLRQFVEGAAREVRYDPPRWVGFVAQRLRTEPRLSVTELAAEIGRHPSWLGSTYHRVYGERLQETVARIRVERAARLLRETDRPFVQVALEAGFCDQSHMNRIFRRLLGRSPSAVRQDRKHLRQIRTTATSTREQPIRGVPSGLATSGIALPDAPKSAD